MGFASCGSARDPHAPSAWRPSSPVSSKGEELVIDSRSHIVLLGEVEERILDEVRPVEPGSKPGVQAQLHHAPEPLAMLVKERCQRRAVVAAELLDRDVRIAGRLGQEGFRTHYPRAGQQQLTEKWNWDRQGVGI